MSTEAFVRSFIQAIAIKLGPGKRAELALKADKALAWIENARRAREAFNEQEALRDAKLWGPKGEEV